MKRKSHDLYVMLCYASAPLPLNINKILVYTPLILKCVIKRKKKNLLIAFMFIVYSLGVLCSCKKTLLWCGLIVMLDFANGSVLLFVTCEFSVSDF
jgi:hypothetical protein